VLNQISVQWVYDNYSHGVSLLISGLFCASSVYVSIVLIRGHQKHFFHPESQQQVIRILWYDRRSQPGLRRFASLSACWAGVGCRMVPVYSICSFCSLIFIEFSLYIDFLRACYEAFVIYSFMILLTT
jgi:hypothetical protein